MQVGDLPHGSGELSHFWPPVPVPTGESHRLNGHVGVMTAYCFSLDLTYACLPTGAIWRSREHTWCGVVGTVGPTGPTVVTHSSSVGVTGGPL